MNNFTIFLVFILIMTSMFMAFPDRASKATKCLIQLVGALFISKAFQAITTYFNRK
jgi:ABC-type enterochelin transport system permease subunit